MSSNKKNKYALCFFIIAVIIVIFAAIYFYKSSNNKKSQDQNNESANNVARLASDSNILGNTSTDQEINNKSQNAISENTPPKEEEISSYSSPLKSKASGRLNNIRITCLKLNGVTVSSGDTFSFCNTIGPSKASDGYEKADVIMNGEIIQALGGGNCQVSSTLYNAVLAVSELEVVERHEHGKDVSYVPDGKDAAVSYGSLDFKFKNNLPNNIKLYFSSDDENVTVRIVKLIKQ